MRACLYGGERRSDGSVYYVLCQGQEYEKPDNTIFSIAVIIYVNCCFGRMITPSAVGLGPFVEPFPAAVVHPSDFAAAYS